MELHCSKTLSPAPRTRIRFCTHMELHCSKTSNWARTTRSLGGVIHIGYIIISEKSFKMQIFFS